MNFGNDRRRIADNHFIAEPLVGVAFIGLCSVPGVLANRLPQNFSVGHIKRDNAGIRLSANEHDQAVPIKDRRAAHSEEPFRQTELFSQVLLPD